MSLERANEARAEKARRARAEIEAMRARIAAAGGGHAPGDTGHAAETSVTLSVLAAQPRQSIPDTLTTPETKTPLKTAHSAPESISPDRSHPE
ncbi:MAG: hypothetical protein M0Z92_14135 [Actinomycetota bacterium]|nr:hypothetical protein [Actinomycetota bacterium]